jgi:hypothetical protein
MESRVMALNVSNKVRRSSGFVESEVDGEIVALNIETGKCYGLNNVASRVWALIAEPRRVVDICQTLVSEYDVDDEACREQILELLEELRAEGMIELHEGPAPGTP